MPQRNPICTIDNRNISIAGVDTTRLFERLSQKSDALFAVAKYLAHPSINDYRGDPLAALGEQVVYAARYHVQTHRASKKPHVADVVLNAVFHAEMSETDRQYVLGGVAREAHLTAPVTKRMKDNGMRVEMEVPIGDRRADIVFFEKTMIWFGRRIVAVELKNNYQSCGWLEEQVDAYGRAADEVRVVMTPQCMIGLSHHKGWLCEPGRVAQQIEKMGASLYVYDATDDALARVHEVKAECHKQKRDELWDRFHSVAAPTANT